MSQLTSSPLRTFLFKPKVELCSGHHGFIRFLQVHHIAKFHVQLYSHSTSWKWKLSPFPSRLPFFLPWLAISDSIFLKERLWDHRSRLPRIWRYLKASWSAGLQRQGHVWWHCWDSQTWEDWESDRDWAWLVCFFHVAQADSDRHGIGALSYSRAWWTSIPRFSRNLSS